MPSGFRSRIEPVAAKCHSSGNVCRRCPQIVVSLVPKPCDTISSHLRLPTVNHKRCRMGRVVVLAVIESLEDLYRVSRSELAVAQARRVEVAETLVDTGATGLSLPRRLIDQLDLLPIRTRRAVTTAGIREVPTYGAVKLTVQERDCICDVTEVDDACPVLIGQVPLELMDLVVDPGRRQLVGNPAHGGEHTIELM